MLRNMRNRHAPLTVLLVDDEALFRSIARAMLAALGCEVLEAVDGLQAVQMVQQEQVTLGYRKSIETSLPGLDNLEIELGRVLRKVNSGQIRVLCIVFGVEYA